MYLSRYPKNKSSLSLFIPYKKPKLLREISSSMQNMLKPLEISKTKVDNSICVETSIMPVEQMDSYESEQPTNSHIHATSNLILPIIPPFPKTSDPSYKKIFLEKLKLCKEMCDFDNPKNDLTAKTIKEQTLNEINTEFIQLGFNTYTDDEIKEEIYDMIMTNLLRKQKPFDLKLFFNADASSYKSDDWQHMQYVYKILFNMIKTFPRFHRWNFDMIYKLFPLLSSKDPNERDQIVMLYISFSLANIRQFPKIFQKIDSILMNHRESNPDPCGVSSVLYIITRVISNNQNYIDILTNIFRTQLLPLFADPYLSVFQQPLFTAIKLLIHNDNSLVDEVIEKLIIYWPITKPEKEEIALNLLHRCLDSSKHYNDSIMISRIVGIVARCCDSEKFTIAEVANKIIQSPSFIDIVSLNPATYAPILMRHLDRARFHWAKSVRDLANNATKYVTRLDPKTMGVKEERIDIVHTPVDVWAGIARKASKHICGFNLGDKLMEISRVYNKGSDEIEFQRSELAFSHKPIVKQCPSKLCIPKVEKPVHI